MTKEIRLPELGEDIETGEVVKILVSAGDTLTEDQAILELETDKAVIEVPAPFGGTVSEIHVQAGEKIRVGQLLLTVDEDSKGKKSAQPLKAGPELVAEEEAEQVPVAEEVEEEHPEVVEERKQETAPVSQAPEEEKAPSEERQQAEQKTAPSPERPIIPAAPSVRRFARELGVDLTQVPGTGPMGRISIEDVKNYNRQLLTESRHPRLRSPVQSIPLPDFTQWGAVERKAISSVRRKTAEHLSQVWATVPQVTHFDRADITELEELRKRFTPRVEAAGGKLTVTAIILKVVVSALKVFPQFNASIDMDAEEIIYKKYYHIGVAVDTDRGLLVPVIRNVDQKNLIELSIELAEMAEKSRQRKISLEEMQGGTFTVTNLGGIGGTDFSPIVHAPEVAILGVARARMEPVWTSEQFVPRLMLPLCLSYDHRLIDGADAARFLRWVVEALQQPFLLTLEG